MAEDACRCRKHPSTQPPGGGVCPVCLRARLLRLCPECAGERPRGCSCPFTSSAAQDAPGYAAAAAAAASVSHLIDGEPELRRSRSAASRLLRPGSDGAAGDRPHGGRGWSWLWPFARKEKAGKEGAKDHPSGETRLPRSRSVAVVPDAGAFDGGGDVKGKRWSRYFAITVKSFRLRRTSRVIQARSPRRAAQEQN